MQSQGTQLNDAEQMSCGTLEFTGERMVPEQTPRAVFWEHIYRYRFASDFVMGRRVLDIACGEGYGAAALLRAGAESVVGVDICPETCEHARRKYGIDARVGDVHSIPLPGQTIDIVVSFETIEHVDSPERFLDECCRVLVPGGTLLVSTPNREFYGESGSGNPFHCSELSEEEITSLVATRFKNLRVFTQRITYAPWWSRRSLCAPQSPWLRLRGFGRLREIIRALVCPHTRGNVSERHRQSPIEAVLARDGPLSELVNEYAIRERLPMDKEEFEYLVVVAGI